jgi:PEP-CTERM motif
MIRKSIYSLPLFVGLALAAVTNSVWASPYIGTGEYFVDPDGWNIGDAGSTYQAWDDFADNPPGPPSHILPPKAADAGVTTNPVLGTGPTVTGLGTPGAGPGDPGVFILITGTDNLYSPVGNYTLNANIPNHGTAGGDGTHVIVQAAASVGDPPVSVVPNTLQIVDLSDNPLAGGANNEALVNGGVLAAGTVDSFQGPVSFEVLVWEFFLPNHTGDFRVQWTEGIHSTFDQLRVDSFIAPTAFAPTAFSFQQVPEPGSLVIGLLGLASVFVARRSRA